MWKYLSNKILRNRIAFITGLILATVFMGYEAGKIELSYDFAKILPSNDSTYIDYLNFKQTFGEDGNVMVIGFQDKALFNLKKFNDWYTLSEDIKRLKGIQEVMSVAKLYNVVRNDSLDKFDFKPVVTQVLKTQQEADSIKGVIYSLPIYEGLIYNKESGATLMAITFNKADLNSKHRIELVGNIKQLAGKFAEKHNIKIHYSGMPYIRTEFMAIVSSEMVLFLVLAILVTALILWIFFRSFTSVLFSIVVVIIGVIWSVGILHLLNYKITILTGLIPPLIIVIGIPNCIFLINKYHLEFSTHGNKIKALTRTIQTIGLSLFLANITTAIGFGVLYFTNSSLLVEFGIVAAINVIITYFITLILIPIILSFLPEPAAKFTKHLEAKKLNKVLELIDYLVHNKRKVIYMLTTVVTIISLYGMTKIEIIGFVVDDLPEKHPIYSDLRFFEQNFRGVLPFEVLIDTKSENGVFNNNAEALYKIKSLQKLFAAHPEFSKSLSVVDAIKFSYQAHKGGNPKYYILPGITELQKLSGYGDSIKGKKNRFQSFIDSTKRLTRVTAQIADIGSEKMKLLVADLRPEVDSIFDPEHYNVKLTGHSLMFLKGNDYLLKNLIESLIIEIVLIILVGLALFRSVRIIFLSKLPCLIPLVITAGIMGFLGIRFKPSTILIFSIAFGISSDGTIYFLTKYRQELKHRTKSVTEAISATIKDTGISMIYTAIILFCGFAIFIASSFGGTVALGVLISVTLLVSMVTNLILLPSLLLSIDKKASKKEMLAEPLVGLEED
ncbi:MAG: MMPL family transporter [Bacteroidetes bacterium]|nr:MMPL family transporter [Bacteroidota bacterium]